MPPSNEDNAMRNSETDNVQVGDFTEPSDSALENKDQNSEEVKYNNNAEDGNEAENRHVDNGSKDTDTADASALQYPSIDNLKFDNTPDSTM